ncbi:DEAD/DEAH box helicase [Thiomonas bhubaneswarensis]|uniref:DNA 3'-5' helicase II n=1 Tax=Thiomonas bhubaneswarensis TaxID=339866 RepID=A0A0K6IBK3_9BURK|nr:3'-5' exonuclease [Thiomonas bhubaneswarensis]CUB00515.1 Nuclease-related domain/UvrD-like helicase C-terminal domain [Thiomonas bhubaneswarensis]
MATLIPALGSCVSRMTSGERRTAERLEQKLDDDYLLWYDVAVGPKHQHPDFVVMHPRRGILILEVKDFRLSTLIQANKQTWDIHGELGPKTLPNPLEQARQYAHQVVNALERDPQLVHPNGRHQGKLAFPWSYGVVLPNITRAQFDKAELGHAIEPHRVICQDEMLEAVEPEALQSRLWDMFPFMMSGVMSLPQMDRVRWIMFPEVRVQATGELFDDADEAAELPSIMRVMDLQQEQLARSLGDGHRVIHGVAGSGKTMLLGYRAEHLAKAQTAASKPILILCYNEPLARQIARVMTAKGIADRVHAVHFHKWCRQQLVAYGQDLPPQNPSWDAFFEDMVQRVITGVDRRQIPSGQYQAVLIDEGHDFAPEWLRLVVQMVDPATNSLLVLYDDAQSIYERTQKKNFRFKSVGIQAQGRTRILQINYRNTRQILETASLVAADLLRPEDKDDDGVPLLKPVSCGRDGEAPLIVRLPTLREEVAQVAELLATAHREGHAWADMAILCRHHSEMDLCAEFLRKRKLPHQVRRNSSSVFDPAHDSIKVMTLHVSKGLEFPVVALVGAGRMPAEGEDEREEARLFYVGATRATQRLVIGASGGGRFAARL